MYFLLDCRNNRSIKITLNNVAMLQNLVKIMTVLDELIKQLENLTRSVRWNVKILSLLKSRNTRYSTKLK